MDRIISAVMFFHKETERSAVNRSMLKVIQKQAMIAEKAIQRGDREVAEVLVIDGVEFAMLDKIEQIGNLDNKYAVPLEKLRNAINETAQVCDMREHVVGEKDIGPLLLLKELLRQTQGEEGIEREDAPLEGGARS